jgi:serine phosphatase RsbU (regulator of sigma subunit)/anti-sigma regulatory factor (Ser/Thr protein kinase)
MPTLPQHVQRTFPAQGRSVAAARLLARETLLEWGAPDMVDSAALLVSELVTNAVVHTGTEVRLDLRLDSGGLRIVVEDRHPGRELSLAAPLPRDDSESGRGLLITAALASSWGVEYTADTKRVWVRCEREVRPAPGPHPFTRLAADDQPRVGVATLSPAGVVTGWNADAVALSGWAVEDAVGRRFDELLDPEPGERPPPNLSPGPQSWQGGYRLLRKDGSTVEVFATHAAVEGAGTTALLVPQRWRQLLEHPAPATVTARTPTDPLGLRDDALLRVGLEEYLTLAAERVRDLLAAEATYLLLLRDLDDVFEVVAVSGLADDVRGTRLAPGSLGAPDPHSPGLPVLMEELPGPGGALLAGVEARSLAVVPVVVEGRVIGALGAARESSGGFGAEESALLQRCADSLALTTDRARLQSAERERRGWLSFIAEAGDLLAGSLDQRRTMAITGQIMVPRLATWSAVYLTDERDNTALQQVWHRDEQQADALRAALSPSDAPASSESSDLPAGDSVTSIPLVARGRRIGWLVLGRAKGDPLREDLLLVAESVARRAALAIDNAGAHGELRATGEALQRSLLPHAMPTVPGLDIGVVYEAAGEGTAAGGDFYDLFPVSGGRWCFVVGDVCGAGAEAAAVTGLARHTIRALIGAGFSVPATLERLNTAILEEGARGRFLTLVCGVLRRQGRRVHVSLVNAGHPLPFLVTGDGVGQVTAPQPLLGVIDTVAYAAEEHVLHQDDLLVVLTDGVTERREGTRMVEDRGVVAELAGSHGRPAQAAAERLRRLVVDFTDHPPQDDMAILALRVAHGL